MFIPYSETDQCAAVTDFGERCANTSYERPLYPKDQLDCNVGCGIIQSRVSTLRDEMTFPASPQQP